MLESLEALSSEGQGIAQPCVFFEPSGLPEEGRRVRGLLGLEDLLDIFYLFDVVLEHDHTSKLGITV